MTNVAVLLVDRRTMEVKALVGSGNFFSEDIRGQINGTLAKRSPGSSLKPFIYALAIDQGLIHPHTVLKDAPAQFGAYDPENFDRDFVGPIKAKDALTLSRNIPAIGLMNQLKDPDFYDFLVAAHVRGLKPKQHYGLSLALGGAEVTMQELVSLYAMLANQGIWRPLRMEAKQPQVAGEPLLSPEAAFLTLDILRTRRVPNGLTQLWRISCRYIGKRARRQVTAMPGRWVCLAPMCWRCGWGISKAKAVPLISAPKQQRRCSSRLSLQSVSNHLICLVRCQTLAP